MSFMNDARKVHEKKHRVGNRVSFSPEVDEETNKKILRSGKLHPLEDSSISPSSPNEQSLDSVSPVRPEATLLNDFFQTIPWTAEILLRGIELITSLSLGASLLHIGVENMPSSSWLVIASIITFGTILRLCFSPNNNMPLSQIFAIDVVLLSFWFQCNNPSLIFSSRLVFSRWRLRDYHISRFIMRTLKRTSNSR